MNKAEKHTLAYELYNSLGEKRTCKKVAELMGLSEKTIKTWSYKYKWQEKLEQEYKEKSEEIKRKREQLEGLGLDVAITALKKIQEDLGKSELSKETAQIYEIYLKTPFDVGFKGETVKEQSAYATPDKIEIKLDLNGGVSDED